MLTLTRVHCDPVALLFMWYYITASPMLKIQLRNCEGIPNESIVSTSNLNRFSIKCTERTFYLSICLVRDYKYNAYLTIDYLKYDFIKDKALLLEENKWGPFYFDEYNIHVRL